MRPRLQTLPFLLPCLLSLACSSGGDGAGRGDGGSGPITLPPDAGGSAFEACFGSLPAEAPFIEVQGFETEDGAIRLWRARHPGDRGGAVGETFAYDLVRFAVEWQEDNACIGRAAALAYEFAHHNWDERWEADTSNHHFAVREELAFVDAGTTWNDTLTVTSPSGAAVLGPVPLRAAGCFSVPYDLNPCMQRTRVDPAPPSAGGE